MCYLDNCISTIAEGGLIDFAKAFDIVPHRRLLVKLNAFGVQGKLFNWIKEFLCGRTLVVKVNGTQSEAAAVLSGIPRGTALGPLLFVVYINDILDNVESEGLLFADDTKISRDHNSDPPKIFRFKCPIICESFINKYGEEVELLRFSKL